MVADGVRAREAHDAERVGNALAPHAERHIPGPESTGWLVNLSFLTERGTTAGFLEAVDTLRQENPHLDLTVNGPLPPYSFVQTAPATGA